LQAITGFIVHIVGSIGMPAVNQTICFSNNFYEYHGGASLAEWGANDYKKGFGFRFLFYSSILVISVVVTLVGIFVLSGFGSSTVFDPPGLLPVLNLVFLSICPIIVGYMAAKGYLSGGSVSLLMLAGGVFSMAMGSFIAGFLLPVKGANAVITVHNVSVLLSGIFHLSGLLLAVFGFRQEKNSKKRKINFMGLFTFIFAFLAILAFLVLQDSLPLFFIQGQGPTILRQTILGVANIFFLFSAFMMFVFFLKFRGVFLYWYSAALVLISIGLFCIFIQTSFGSPIGWLGRIAQYIGGLYLVMAVFFGAKEQEVMITQFDKVLEQFFRNRFEVLLEERTAQLAVTNEKLQLEIEKRTRTEKALRESENKFKYVFDHSPIGKSIIHISGEIQANKSFYEMLGYSWDEHKNFKWQDITHPDDIDQSQNVIDSLLSGKKESDRFIKRYLHKNGSIVWVDLRTAVRKDTNGTPLYLMAAMSDITQQREADAALKKQQQFLQKAQEIGNIGTWELDLEKNQLLWTEQNSVVSG